LSPKARQISLTVCRLIPCRWAIDRVDQCAASLGVVSSVSTTTASTTSSLIVRAAPGLGASASSSSRSAANRWRHLPAVTLSQPSSPAILVFGLPSAQASTIRDRNANACDDECRRDQRTSVSRSSSASSIATVGQPACPITGSFCRGSCLFRTSSGLRNPDSRKICRRINLTGH